MDINVCESMGANVVNTVCESLTETIEVITQGRVSTKILTNLCLKRKAVAEFCIPVRKLATKAFTVSFTLIISTFFRVKKLQKEF